MNENLQKALEEILKSSLTAKEFLVSEAPEVIQQLLTYNFVLSICGTLVGIILLVPLYPLWKWAIKLAYEEDECFGIFPVAMYSLVAGIPGLILTFNLEWLKIWLAPKVYLIEYVADLVKENT